MTDWQWFLPFLNFFCVHFLWNTRGITATEDEHQSKVCIPPNAFCYTWLSEHQELLPYSHKALCFVVFSMVIADNILTLSEGLKLEFLGLISKYLQSLNSISFHSHLMLLSMKLIDDNSKSFLSHKNKLYYCLLKLADVLFMFKTLWESL